MHVHVLQHVPFEGPGACADWFRAERWGIETVALFDGAPPPVVEEVKFLLVMGGPMSVNDEAEHPWLVAEKQLIRAAVEAGRPVLGICLGAQLIASAFGARVYANPEKEIGWWPVQGIHHGDPASFTFPRSFTPLHWHGETFDLPPGALHLAHAAACAQQAFQLGPRAIGLQFHLESTPETVAALIAHCSHELAAGGPWVQDASTLLDNNLATRTRETHRILGDLLGWLVR
jgi:GMP synthase-like glutamine amidotransferase